ncbi:MAG: hypothetical protein DRO52_03485 [Candidatus Hecatellales archaeon]|nr:MAG: hypothetical protein DRO52_03485 [Candidatus Hecatellales archaeon]
MAGESRRDFLKTAATAGVVGFLGGEFFLNALKPLEARPPTPALEKYYTSCGVCHSNCGIRVYVKDGVIRFLDGNPEDLHSGGKVCAKGVAGSYLPYAPDRLKYPLKRTNPEKGIEVDPGWVTISWEEALDTTAKRLGEIKEKYGPQSIIFIAHPTGFSERLRKALGSPNRITHHDTCIITHVVVEKFTIGTKLWMYDFPNSKYILCFGWDQPSKGKVPLTRRFSEAKRRGAKIVVVNPLVTLMSSQADEWISIIPGTDLAFALAMINVIISEDLYDKEYVRKYTNFEEHEEEIRNWVKDYTPEWASTITGVPAETIRRIAKEFATTKPSVIPMHKRDPPGPNYANSWKLCHAIIILNALVGSIDNVGGWLFTKGVSIPSLDKVYPPPPYPKPPVSEDICGRSRLPLLDKVKLGIFSTLANNILAKKPYEVKAAIIYKYNLLAFPNPKRLVEALKQLEFIVTIDVLPSESVQLADIVLPDCTYLEREGFSVRIYNGWYPQVSVFQPVIKTMYDCRSADWIFCELGKRLAPDYFKKPDGAFFTPSEYVREALVKGIGITFEELAQRGIWSKPERFKPFAKLESMVKAGKKIQIYGETFKKYGYDPLPSWQPRRDNPSPEYPLYLLITRPPVHRHGKTTDNPYLLELYPENVAVIHPETAEKLGIKDLDLVWVESRTGRVRVKAKLFEGIRKDCVCIPHGFGHWSRGLIYGYGRGVNDGDLIPDQTIEEIIDRGDPTGGACMCDVCVKVYKG